MQRFLFRAAAPAAFCLAVTHALAQSVIATPILASDENFRDLAGIARVYGGTGYADATANNGVMRPGIFYRSAALTLGNADFATVSGLGTRLDIDLRTPAEIATARDRVPTGAAYVNVNIFGTPGTPSSSPTSPADAVAQDEAGYRTFVTSPVERAGFATVLLDLAQTSGPAVYHCESGKDRTGWTSILLRSIAGVPTATIMQGYLATNQYTAGKIDAEVAAAQASSGTAAAAIVAQTAGVQSGFAQAALAQVTTSYGSMNAYLTQGLGLSQADIYVLRARMVDYLTLPGQSTFAGNAASGAALLNQLRNSPLSGSYTPFNYYLRSAIDAGSLGGVQSRVGGQLTADAASFLSRQPLWLDAALSPYVAGPYVAGPYVDGRDLASGETRIWMTDLGGYFATAAHDGAAAGTEGSAGSVIGATWRIDTRASLYVGMGYDWGSVGSAGAHADVGTALGTVGGRFAFTALDQGPYVAARADVGGVDYHGTRPLDDGLGTASGTTAGAVVSGQAVLGYVFPLASFTVTPHAGARITHVTLGGFDESGSELALSVARLSDTAFSLPFGIDVGLAERQLAGWSVTPTASLGAELALGNTRVASSASVYGIAVNQYAAYDSRYLLEGGLGFTARRGAFSVKAGVNAVLGDGSSGVNGQLTVAYAL
jgi:protein-tyrosine phosphatase